MIQDHYRSSMWVESWGRPYSEDNEIRESSQGVKIEDITWKHTQDHSKWIVMRDTQVVCIGDMNLQDSQVKRGGSFHCLDHEGLYDMMDSMLIKRDDSY